jgi:ferredoxin-type protein NapH
MLVYLGIICRENMQIEGFWYYLFLGVFEATTIHYFVAKMVQCQVVLVKPKTNDK